MSSLYTNPTGLGRPETEPGNHPVEPEQRRLTREEQQLLAKQTYAPARLCKKPKLLRAYLLLHSEFGGSRPWQGSMSEIAAALHVTERCARERIVALEAERVLEVERRPGHQSVYRLLHEDLYIEMPLLIAVHGNHAVCAVWGALRMALGPGRSALRCETAAVKMPWARIQAMTGLCRTAVAEALRWLRKKGWLSRRVVWASIQPIRRAVCRWKLRMRTPEKIRTPPRNEPGRPPPGGSKDTVEPLASLSGLQKSPEPGEGTGERAARIIRESVAEGVDVFAAWRNLVQ